MLQNLLILDDLMLNHGLLVTGSWEQLNFKEDTKLYIKSLLKMVMIYLNLQELKYPQYMVSKVKSAKM
jgi:hypothetical protein